VAEPSESGARIEPRPRDELPEFEPTFQLLEQTMGFLPASLTTMARIPALFETFGAFAATVMNAGLDRGLVQLIAHVASTAAGCRYCQAHTAAQAHHLGIDAEKIADVWTFETDERFTDAERAALRLARDAAQIPNLATEAHFTELAAHFDEDEIVQIVAVISLFGYLNRWNDTMATTLEAEPLAFANRHLAGRGWQPGKHEPNPTT
jgi:uncharacterized peroxidase-related enzyme